VASEKFAQLLGSRLTEPLGNVSEKADDSYGAYSPYTNYGSPEADDSLDGSSAGAAALLGTTTTSTSANDLLEELLLVNLLDELANGNLNRSAGTLG